MWIDGTDAVNYIEHNLKIKLNKEYNNVDNKHYIVAKLVIGNTIISEDKIEFENFKELL